MVILLISHIYSLFYDIIRNSDIFTSSSAKNVVKCIADFFIYCL